MNKIAFHKYKISMTLLYETKYNFNLFIDKLNDTNKLFFISKNIKKTITSLINGWNNHNLKNNNIEYFCNLQYNNAVVNEYFVNNNHDPIIKNLWFEYIKTYRLSILTLIDLDQYMFDNNLINNIK